MFKKDSIIKLLISSLLITFITSTSPQNWKYKNLIGHTGSVWALYTLPNGDLASGSSDKSVIIWDTDKGTIKKRLEGHTDKVVALSLLLNGDLASGSLDKNVIIWNLKEGTIRKVLKGCRNIAANSMTLLPNGYLAIGSDDTLIEIWNVEDNARWRILEGNTDSIKSLFMHPGGYLISGSLNEILIWDFKSGTIVKRLNSFKNVLTALTLLSDGNLASATLDKQIQIWNLNNTIPLSSFDSNEFYIFSIIPLLSNKMVTGSMDSTAKIWNIKSGSVEKVFGQSGTNPVLSMVSLENDQYLATGYNNGSLIIWNINY
jgi:WD40 repeat protein